MRLYPPAWVIGRQAINAHRVGDFEIPAQGVVLMSQYIVHRDPRWWERPDEFLPERWLNEQPNRPRYAYFPFGGGPRQCIGESFAWTEGVLVLATLAQRFVLELRPEYQLRLRPSITLRPRDPVPMRIAAR
jgi:cytochrome P450